MGLRCNVDIDFQTVTKLPGIENAVFPSGHLHAGCCWSSVRLVTDERNFSFEVAFFWKLDTADLLNVSVGPITDTNLAFPGVKTFEELCTLFRFLSLPYPENWP